MAPGATTIKILIVGGGLGGLTLAVLLEKAKIAYELFEKQPDFNTYGSTINLNCQVFGFFDQLDLFYDHLEDLSKPFKNFHLQTLNPKTNKFIHNGTFATRINEVERYGYDNRVISRPDLVKKLLSRIPTEKIHLNKTVIRTEQSEKEGGEGVKIFCQDGTEYSGDLLIGADGTYSNVRECLYKELASKELLPEIDTEPMAMDMTAIVGVSETIKILKEHPTFSHNEAGSEFQVVLVNGQPLTVWYFPLTDLRLGWMVTEEIRELGKPVKKSSKDYKSVQEQVVEGRGFDFRTTESFETLKLMDQHKTPFNLTFGELVAKTPREVISKRNLESKHFETWTSGRTALIGDACRTALPFGTNGAIQAMLDALELSSLIYEMKDNTYADIQKIFTDYYTVRREHSITAVQDSLKLGQLMTKKGVSGTILRSAFLNFIPSWYVRQKVEKLMYNRPQAPWLEWTNRLGYAPAICQTYSERMVDEAIRSVPPSWDEFGNPIRRPEDMHQGELYVVNGSQYMAKQAKLKAEREEAERLAAIEAAAAEAAAIEAAANAEASEAAGEVGVMAHPDVVAEAVTDLAEITNSFGKNDSITIEAMAVSSTA